LTIAASGTEEAAKRKTSTAAPPLRRDNTSTIVASAATTFVTASEGGRRRFRGRRRRSVHFEWRIVFRDQVLRLVAEASDALVAERSRIHDRRGARSAGVRLRARGRVLGNVWDDTGAPVG
jgi:hypothetical protein